MNGQVLEHVSTKIPSQQMDYPCLFPFGEFHVVRNKKDFKSVALDWEQKHCKKIGYPKIDFKKNALIGLKKHVRSCDLPEMKYEILKLDDLITVEIQFFPNGNCQTSYECIYWFRIPLEHLLDNDYSFELNERYVYTNEEEQ